MSRRGSYRLMGDARTGRRAWGPFVGGGTIIADGRSILARRAAPRTGPTVIHAPVIVVSPAGRYLPAMLATLLFAALAGLLTVLSPCVLPVIPLLVGAATGPGGATDRGGRRVAGLIVGFGAAFIAATVVLASTLAAVGVTTSQLRVASALLLVAFGADPRRPGTGQARRALGEPGDRAAGGGDPSWIREVRERDGAGRGRRSHLVAVRRADHGQRHRHGRERRADTGGRDDLAGLRRRGLGATRSDRARWSASRAAPGIGRAALWAGARLRCAHDGRGPAGRDRAGRRRFQARVASLLPDGWRTAIAAVGTGPRRERRSRTLRRSRPGAAGDPLRNVDGRLLPAPLADDAAGRECASRTSGPRRSWWASRTGSTATR